MSNVSLSAYLFHAKISAKHIQVTKDWYQGLAKN